MKEIERKFLVKSESWKPLAQNLHPELMEQGYLNSDPDRVVRVRRVGDQAWLTIKNRPVGITRSEFEYAIPASDAADLLKLCLGTILIKRRYEVVHEGYTWEVDVYEGSLDGLVVAEIELSSEDDIFSVPDWIGQEVTHVKHYSNLALAMGLA